MEWILFKPGSLGWGLLLFHYCQGSGYETIYFYWNGDSDSLEVGLNSQGLGLNSQVFFPNL